MRIPRKHRQHDAVDGKDDSEGALRIFALFRIFRENKSVRYSLELSRLGKPATMLVSPNRRYRIKSWIKHDVRCTQTSVHECIDKAIVF